MPLLPVSPNAKVSHVAAGKRPQNEFANASVDALDCENLSAQKSPIISTATIECQPQIPSTPVTRMASPPRSSPAALSEASSSTPTRNSPSPNATPSKSTSSPETTSVHPADQQSIAKPTSASKRKRNVTTAEEREKGRAEKRQRQENVVAERAKVAAEKEAIKAAKAAERASKAAEKATKAAEKARAEAEKEALKAAKAVEKAKTEAAKEAKRLKKQEEELAAKAKKEKQQNIMASFLKKAPTTPSKANDLATTVKADTGNPLSTQEARSTKSAYELNFKPFFVKPGVTMAAPLFAMDDETKEVKSAILDEHIRGDRGEFNPKHPFDASEVFQLAFPQQRGIIPPSVKKIMERIHGDSYQNAFGIGDARSESQTEKLVMNAQGQLDDIPMKYIRFYEDLRKLSRRPARKILPLAYDYDSEAEWVEDDGEDLDDAEDEEEDPDGDEEMDDFVDDSEAIPTIIRPGFETDSMPVSTGLCYENQKRLGPSTTVYKYRLEFLLDSLEHHYMIDPFSTQYWPHPIKKSGATATASSTKGTITSMLAPTEIRDAATSTPSTAPASDLKDGVPHDILEDFKRALLSDKCRDYSKATVIEMLAKKFTSCTKAQVKVTLDTIAHRVTPAEATKKSVKRWVLLPNFGLQGT